MKTKTGLEVDVLGQIQIDNKPHFIVKMPHAFYESGILIAHILLPASELDGVNNGIPPAEVVE